MASSAEWFYFCTCGRGTEKFVSEEIVHRLNATKVEVTDGKVFWCCDDLPGTCQQLLQLKSIERIFLCLLHKPQFYLHHNGISSLYKVLTDPSLRWLETLKHWQQVAYRNNEDKPDTEEPLNKKRRTEDGDVIAGNNTEEGHPYLKSTSPSGLGSADIQTEQAHTTFRVSCKCSGRSARTFSSQELGRLIGISLKKQLGWKCELRNPLLEIVVQITDSGLTIGFPLKRSPLSSRVYMKQVGLRTPVAWCMAQQAKIKAGEVVLDPMCGQATILIEATKSWQDAVYIGCDIDANQLDRACENRLRAGESNQIELFHGDVKKLPLADASVDVVLCDTPFGMKHGTEAEAEALLSPMLHSMDRVLRDQGRAVLLTSRDLKVDLLEHVHSVCGKLIEPAPSCEKLIEPAPSGEKPIEPAPSGEKPIEPALCGNASDDATTGSPSSSIKHSSWSTNLVQYIKLGETHAFMCVFTKICPQE